MSADASVAPPSATVVIAQRVRPGREKDYLCWQAEMNELCRTFPGYEAAEVVPPVAGVQSDYVVVFRFDTFPHLEGWLKSDAHRALLARGQDVFAGDARQHVVAGPHAATVAAGMVVSTRVKPGREAEFRTWQTTIDQEAARFPGFLGNEVFPSVPGLQEDWVVVVRYDSAKHLQNWLESEPRRRLNQQAATLWDEARVESFGGGFPGWFTAGRGESGQAALPAVWKQAMTVILVLYPTVFLLSRYLSPWLTGLPFAASLFVSNVASVSILTWLLMPVVVRAFDFWLSPPPSRRMQFEVLGLLAVLAGYAVALSIFTRLF
jgi:antibiotic biosynthesis monooxygenase (ABM) superfamily enzyme